MTTIYFTYQSKNTIIQCNENDNVKNIFERFCNKTGLNINLLYFLYDGNTNINTQVTIGELANKEDKIRKSMSILVNELNEINDNTSIMKSREVICKCGEVANLYFDDFKINIECRAGHKTKNLLFNEFERTQLIDVSKIICENCRLQNKNASFGKKFYRCNYCKKNLCPLCRSKHDKSHLTIDYDLKNYLCQIHERDYNSYCLNCKLNLCQFCEKDHKQHNLIFFGKMIPSPEDLKTKFEEIKKKVENLIKTINEITEKFSKAIQFMESYLKIATNIVNNYDMGKINYETLNNIRQVIETKDTTNYIYQELDEINEYVEAKKAYKIIDIYNKMCEKEKDYITLYYKVNANDKKIKLFSDEFVKNNNEICSIIMDDKKKDLLSEYDLENVKIKEQVLEIKLKGVNKINIASYMFSYYRSLTLPEDISNWKTSNVTNMNKMFFKCEILNLPDISNWDTSQVKDMSNMFSECSSLTKFPDISKWDTSNVIDMQGLFNNCASIEYLPDISKWNTKKVKSMANLFKSCFSLKSLPDISNWNTSQVSNMSYMFGECNKIYSLPDISNWDTSNVRNMSYMFFNCKSLQKVPNINKWNIDNLSEKHKMFEDCNSSLEIPSKFKKKLFGIFPINL